MTRRHGVPQIVGLLILLVTGVARADVLDDVIDRGTLRVGVSLFSPWTMRSVSGDLVGYEIDQGEQIAADIGVEVEFKVYVWEEIIDALLSGEIDLIAGGMAITPARALQVNFTRPYAESGVALAANMRRTASIASLEELDSPEIVVATVADTLAYDVANRVFRSADVRVYDSQEEAEQDLLEGEVQAYVASSPEAVFLALKNPRVVDLPLEELLLSASEAFAVRKGDQDWLNFLNAWIEARKADHWIAVSRRYWFQSLEWLEEVEPAP